MQAVVAKDSKLKTRQVFNVSAALQLIFFLAAGLGLYAGGETVLGMVKILALVAGLVFLLSVITLQIAYLRTPEMREKNRLAGQIKQVKKELAGIQADYARALEKEGDIREKAQVERQVEQEKFDSLTRRIESKISWVKLAREEEIAFALERIQKDYMDQKLKETPLEPALIPGIGALLGEKLKDSQIMTAYDVTAEAVRAIPGVGESKALSLLRWRESVENAHWDGQPKIVPDEIRVEIEQKFDQQIIELLETLNAGQIAYENTIQRNRILESERLAEVAGEEIAARQQMEKSEARRQELRAEFLQYPQIGFLTMLVQSLSLGRPRIVSFLMVLAFGVFGILNIGIFLSLSVMCLFV
jgi:hypothetical protein